MKNYSYSHKRVPHLVFIRLELFLVKMRRMAMYFKEARTLFEYINIKEIVPPKLIECAWRYILNLQIKNLPAELVLSDSLARLNISAGKYYKILLEFEKDVKKMQLLADSDTSKSNSTSKCTRKLKNVHRPLYNRHKPIALCENNVLAKYSKCVSPLNIHNIDEKNPPNKTNPDPLSVQSTHTDDSENNRISSTVEDIASQSSQPSQKLTPEQKDEYTKKFLETAPQVAIINVASFCKYLDGPAVGIRDDKGQYRIPQLLLVNRTPPKKKKKKKKKKKSLESPKKILKTKRKSVTKAKDGCDGNKRTNNDTSVIVHTDKVHPTSSTSSDDVENLLANGFDSSTKSYSQSSSSNAKQFSSPYIDPNEDVDVHTIMESYADYTIDAQNLKDFENNSIVSNPSDSNVDIVGLPSSSFGNSVLYDISSEDLNSTYNIFSDALNDAAGSGDDRQIISDVTNNTNVTPHKIHPKSRGKSNDHFSQTGNCCNSKAKSSREEKPKLRRGRKPKSARTNSVTLNNNIGPIEKRKRGRPRKYFPSDSIDDSIRKVTKATATTTITSAISKRVTRNKNSSSDGIDSSGYFDEDSSKSNLTHQKDSSKSLKIIEGVYSDVVKSLP